jgi:glycosyltransferase involved in cell wall biosynthesis
MRIAFVTIHDPNDVKAWSGSVYFMREALSGCGHTLFPVGPLKERWRSFFRMKKGVWRYAFGKEHLYRREPRVTAGYAEQVRRQIHDLDVDVVFAPGTRAIADLDVDVPVVFWTDSVFAEMIAYYARYSDLTSESVHQGNRMEQRALSRSARAIYTSDWAARSAVRHYEVNPSKVAVLPYGANFEIEPGRTGKDIDQLVSKRLDKKCRLLFVGVDWKRKGGGVCVEIARQLNERGRATELLVVGCSPQVEEELPSFVTSVGYVDKSKEEEKKKFEDLYRSATFLVHPARAECFGVVLAEANAYGVPALASTTGGITTVVRDGVNGKTFPTTGSDDKLSPSTISEEAEQYVRFIERTMKEGYGDLARSAFDEYRSRLNWASAAEQVTAHLREVRRSYASETAEG